MIIRIKEKDKLQGIIGSNVNSLTNLGEREKGREITDQEINAGETSNNSVEKSSSREATSRSSSPEIPLIWGNRRFFAALTDIRPLSVKVKSLCLIRQQKMKRCTVE
jgi:hypothetical protein